MKVIFTWKELILKSGNKIIKRFPASCNVRTEMNGNRKLHKKSDVVKTYPLSGIQSPYMPRQFPSGVHRILSIEWTDDPEYAPVKIKTDATRKVFLWELDDNKGYGYPVEDIQIDTCYWMHYTDSRTTLGCIRIGNRDDAIMLGRMIEAILLNNDKVYLEVL